MHLLHAWSDFHRPKRQCPPIPRKKQSLQYFAENAGRTRGHQAQNQCRDSYGDRLEPSRETNAYPNLNDDQ